MKFDTLDFFFGFTIFFIGSFLSQSSFFSTLTALILTVFLFYAMKYVVNFEIIIIASVLKTLCKNLNFLHIFAIPSSSRHEKRCLFMITPQFGNTHVSLRNNFNFTFAFEHRSKIEKRKHISRTPQCCIFLEI